MCIRDRCWVCLGWVDGADGEDGTDGAAGQKGQKGEIGATGAAGADGADGEDGEDGAAGAAGIKGQKGELGVTGAAGEKGEKGEKVMGIERRYLYYNATGLQITEAVAGISLTLEDSLANYRFLETLWTQTMGLSITQWRGLPFPVGMIPTTQAEEPQIVLTLGYDGRTPDYRDEIDRTTRRRVDIWGSGTTLNLRHREKSISPNIRFYRLHAVIGIGDDNC